MKILTGLLAILLVNVCISWCPSEWVLFNSKCYYIKPSKAELTYDMAVDSCKDMAPESSLVAIETRAEYEFLKNYLSRQHSPFNDTDNGWLTSGRRFDGGWVWDATGEPMDQTAFDWGPHQPENRTTSQQNCLSFWPKSEFKMADTFCWAYGRQFICELEEQGYSVCFNGDQQELTKEDFFETHVVNYRQYKVRGSPIHVNGFKSKTLPVRLLVHETGLPVTRYAMNEDNCVLDGGYYWTKPGIIWLRVTSIDFVSDSYISVIRCVT